MEIKDIDDLTLMRHTKDIRKMKFVKDYISQLPDIVKDGDNMKTMMSYIGGCDTLMIKNHISDLNWLQQHVLFSIFRMLDRNKDVIEKNMESILPILIQKWEDKCNSSK